MAAGEQDRRDFIKATGLTVSAMGSVLVTGSSAAQAAQTPSSASKGAPLRALLAKGELVIAPIVPDIITARLCEIEGFAAVQIGDSQPTAWYGLPSYGLISYTEVLNFSVHLARSTNVAVMAGMGDGGGTPLTIYRATQELERGGVAAATFEDTMMETHFVRQGAVVSKQQFADRIRAAVDARKDPNFLVIARTDALSQGLPMDQVLDRGVAAAAAGADVIYFGGMRLEDYPKAATIIRKPLFHLANARTSTEQVKASKVNMVAYHVDSVAHAALYQAIHELRTTGKYENAAKMSLPAEVQAKLSQRDEYLSRARTYNMIK
jgi:methylisocitrate lyase